MDKAESRALPFTKLRPADSCEPSLKVQSDCLDKQKLLLTSYFLPHIIACLCHQCTGHGLFMSTKLGFFNFIAPLLAFLLISSLGLFGGEAGFKEEKFSPWPT